MAKPTSKLCTSAMFAVMLSLTLLFGSCFSSSAALWNNNLSVLYCSVSPSAVFPSSLRDICDEAFSGTAIDSAYFGDKLVTIGEKAFMNVETLKDVYIPEETSYIGNKAFPRATFIHGAENSYAEKWALLNGYSFCTDYDWAVKAPSQKICMDLLLTLFLWPITSDDSFAVKLYRRIFDFVKSMRPQDRPELYPIDYRFP